MKMTGTKSRSEPIRFMKSEARCRGLISKIGSRLKKKSRPRKKPRNNLRRRKSSLIKHINLQKVLDSEDLKEGDKSMPTPSQIKTIHALKSELKLEDGVNNALRSFLSNRFHIRTFDRIPRKQMAKVIKSLRIMFDRISPKEESKSTRA